jgi:TRAP-type mannitol/chloroaromatic compound transport system permease large subunit
MHRQKVTGYALMGLIVFCLIGTGILFQLGYPIARALTAVGAVVLLLIGQRMLTRTRATEATQGPEKTALVVMAVFLGIGILSIVATGVFRILEGAFLSGSAFLIGGPLLALAGAKFVRDHWPRGKPTKEAPPLGP